MIVLPSVSSGVISSSFFDPKKISGLALWLKADAGVTTEAEQFISQIVISGAGTSTSNGTYTRASGGNTTFNGPNGNTISSLANTEWALYDTQLYNSEFDTYGEDSYYTDTFETSTPFESWYISGQNYGANPEPSGVVTNTPTGNTLVTAWADQSGNGRNATPDNPTDKPLFNASDKNGKPTISLTSMSDEVARVFTISSNPLGASGSTAFSVQYVEDVCGDEISDNGPIFGNFGGSEDSESLAQTHYPYGPDCSVYDAFGTRLRKNEITPPITITNAWTLYSVKSTDNDWQSFVNGQLMHSDPTNTYSSAVGGDDTTLYIGKQTAGGAYTINGKAAEVIVYNRVLTTEERQQVEAYLNDKYVIY